MRIELNSEGIRQLLRSAEISGIVQEVASDSQKRCGDGYDTDTHVTPSRVVASVFTATRDAKQDNIENNTLLKAVSR